MKKFFTLVSIMATALMASANDYTDTMVTYDNQGTEIGSSEQTITLTQAEDGTYTLDLLNWYYTSEYGNTGQGSITLSGLVAENQDGVNVINYEGTVTATKGDLSTIRMWNLAFMGPANHDATILIKFTEDKAYMDINVAASGMNGAGIGKFGTDEFDTTAINAVATQSEAGIYSLDGRKLNAAVAGQTLIIKGNDGSVRKAIIK